MIREQKAHDCISVEIDELVQKGVGLMAQRFKLRKTSIKGWKLVLKIWERGALSLSKL